MTTTGIDPVITRQVINLWKAGDDLPQIGAKTGLMDREIKAIVDQEKRRLAADPPARPAFQPPAVATRPTFRDNGNLPAAPTPVADGLTALIADGQASDMPRVRTAAKRAQAAIDNLHNILAATEAERREKAAAKAKAERARAERAAKEQAARDAVAAAEAALAKAKADLAASGGRRKMTLTDEQREAARARGRIAAARTAEIRRQKRDARLAAEAAT